MWRINSVLGKAVAETGIARYFNIKIQEPETKFVLETEIGPIPIRVDVINSTLSH